MKRVLLIQAGWFHPPYRGRRFLKEALEELPGLSFDEAASLSEATRRGLGGYAAVVLYYHRPNTALAAPELEAFRSYVDQGGGVLAVHSATASYKPTRAYFEILGGRFVGHGPVESIDVRPRRSDDPIFGGIPAFTVHDELYLHELQPDIEVHFEAEHDGRPVPVVWTRRQGQGRVCYVCPGHRSASMQHEAVREIARRGLEWSTGA